MQDKTKSDSQYTERAIYLTPANGFGNNLPPMPRHAFIEERDRAMDPATGTACIDLDLSATIRTAYPATTPNLLARYIRVAAGDSFTLSPQASGEVYFALEGDAVISKGTDRIHCGEWDVVCMPGGGATRLEALDSDCVIYSVTDEPTLAWLGAQAPAAGEGRTTAVHYPAERTDSYLNTVQGRNTDERVTGKFVLFSSPGADETNTATRTISLAMNSLVAGGVQEAHRHNAVALTLCLQGESVYSMVDGERSDWHRNAVIVTPPAALHSHHNVGSDQMLSLVAQDGGLFYNARAVGFSFD
jgi:gentisate 1,2-dioxygenase